MSGEFTKVMNLICICGERLLHQKNKLIVLITLFITCLCYAEDFRYSPLYQDVQKLYTEHKFKVHYTYIDDQYYIITVDGDGEPMIVLKSEINYDSGYKFIPYNLHGYEYRDYLIEGKGIIINDQIRESKIQWRALYEFEKSQKTLSENLRDPITRDWYIEYDDGIKNASASSYLVEGSVVYHASNLYNKLYYNYTIEPNGILYDSVTPPWVEGKDDYGIGEWLNIEFDYETDEIEILNGYVDLRRKHLYMDNSRVKEIEIISENPDFTISYIFEDEVKFSNIKLPVKTKNIKIIIKGVYPGNKYSDTCISMIRAINPDFNFSEDKRLMEQFLTDIDFYSEAEQVREMDSYFIYQD